MVGLHAGTMCHLASTTVMIALIISIEGKHFVFSDIRIPTYP